MNWAYAVLVVAVVAAVAAGLVLGAMRRTARRQQAGLPPLPRPGAPGHPLLRVDGGRPGPWSVPAAAVRGVEVTTNHAGKVVYAERVLVVDWQLGGTVLRSGFVLDDEAAARAWAERVAAVAAAREVRP